MARIPSLLNSLAHRLVRVFLDPPGWAEVTSALAILLYCVLALAGHVIAGRDLATWPSLSLLSDLITPLFWLALSWCVSFMQLTAVLAGTRPARMATSAIAFFWFALVFGFLFTVAPWAPTAGFPLALGFLNLFSVARHARDWGRPLSHGG